MSKISEHINQVVRRWPFSQRVKPPVKKESGLLGKFQFRKKPKKRNLSQKIQGSLQNISKWRR